MSVSLTLIPVALVMRVVMGKEKFNDWVESNLNPQATNFKSRKELTETLHRAGYDALPYGSSIKTHFGNKNYFMWELREGKWTALFSKYDSQADCLKLIEALNRAAGRDVFTDNVETVFNETKQTALPVSQVFPTNFTDMELLEATLQKENIPYRKNLDGTLTSEIKSTALNFTQYKADGVIDLKVENTESLQPIFKQMSVLDEAYRKQIQQQTYDRLVTTAEEKGFYIEQEMELPDESILITLRVGE